MRHRGKDIRTEQAIAGGRQRTEGGREKQDKQNRRKWKKRRNSYSNETTQDIKHRKTRNKSSTQKKDHYMKTHEIFFFTAFIGTRYTNIKIRGKKTPFTLKWLEKNEARSWICTKYTVTPVFKLFIAPNSFPPCLHSVCNVPNWVLSGSILLSAI